MIVIIIIIITMCIGKRLFLVENLNSSGIITQNCNNCIKQLENNQNSSHCYCITYQHGRHRSGSYSLSLKLIFTIVSTLICLIALKLTTEHYNYPLRDDLHHLLNNSIDYTLLKSWNYIFLTHITRIKRMIQYIENIIDFIGYYDPFVMPTCSGSLFQELVNLSQVIERKEKPQIIEEPKPATIIVGQSVLFVCLVEGNPAPKVQWKVSGASVTESRFGKTYRAPHGSVLRVNNALPSHNGAIITCTATNALGQAESSATLTVFPDESTTPPGYPRFLNSFSVIVARKNAEVELECRAAGDPQPEITWFKDSVPIDLYNPRYKKLDIDEGKYECEAKNDKGTRLSSGDNLLVRGCHKVVKYTTVYGNQSVDHSCCSVVSCDSLQHKSIPSNYAWHQ
ncbi:unnamed protein product [Heterobilharzia americana]|nr:unnamed protein product [Heterobilharzia americana]